MSFSDTAPTLTTTSHLDPININNRPLVEKNFSCSKLKLDNLFLQWFALPESQQTIITLLDDAKAGRPLITSSSSSSKKQQHGVNGTSSSSPSGQSNPHLTHLHLHHHHHHANGVAGGGGHFPSSTPPLSPRKAGLAAGLLASNNNSMFSNPNGINNNGGPPYSPGSGPSPAFQRPPPLSPIMQPSSSQQQGSIPQFYFPRQQQQQSLSSSSSVYTTKEGQQLARARIEALCSVLPGGILNIDNLKTIVKEVLNLPCSTAYALILKIKADDGMQQQENNIMSNGNGNGMSVQQQGGGGGGDDEEGMMDDTVMTTIDNNNDNDNDINKSTNPGAIGITLTGKDLLSWFDRHDFWSASPEKQLFDLLKSTTNNNNHHSYITPLDLRPVVAGIVSSHPGLEFLTQSPEFQQRYSETVIYRIFYALNRNGDGRLTMRELRRGDLLAVLHEVDDQEDINRVLRYFSYEHFYVIYCKFWDLDADHDFLLSRDDLMRYGSHALTFRIVDRIFSQSGRPFSSGIPGKMCYQDFVWFILSEEDKTTDAALEYWFKCVDLNGDGRLSGDELMFFYEEQLHRMECLSQECVSFADVMAQMQDMLEPHDMSAFTMRDLKKTRCLSGNLFNVLFNLNKFIAFETKDPFVARQEREDPGLTDWDRFARGEYVRLAVDEDGEEDDDDVDSVEGGSWGAVETL